MQDIRIAAVSMNGRLGEVEQVLAEIDAWYRMPSSWSFPNS